MACNLCVLWKIERKPENVFQEYESELALARQETSCKQPTGCKMIKRASDKIGGILFPRERLPE